MNKIIYALAIVVILSVGAFWYAKHAGEGAYSNKQPNPTNDSSGVSFDISNIYTLSDVSIHSSAESCWSAIGGNVYDLTSWISQHPGGERGILGLCGKDGTEAFTKKHGGKEKPEATLATFKIGVLAQ